MTAAKKAFYGLSRNGLSNIIQHYPHDGYPEAWEHLLNLHRGGCLAVPQVALDLLENGAGGASCSVETYRDIFYADCARQREIRAKIECDYPKVVAEETEKGTGNIATIALLLMLREQSGDVETDYKAVTIAKPFPEPNPFTVTANARYNLGIVAPIRMYRETSLALPAPPGSMIDLSGVWRGLKITDADIERSKLRTGWDTQ